VVLNGAGSAGAVPSSVEATTATTASLFAQGGGEDNRPSTAPAEDSSTETYTVEFTLAAPRTDATLSSLLVDNVEVSGFDPAVLSYDVEVPFATTVVPTVTAVANDESGTVEITAATSLPGSSTVVVTAQDGTTEQTYSVNFSIGAAATDATLSDLQVSGGTVQGFSNDIFSYEVELPFGTEEVPEVTAVATDANASVVVNAASALPGETTIVVTAEDVSVSQTYTVAFTIASATTDASLSDLQVDGETVSGFSPTTFSYEVELPFGTTIVPTVTATKNAENAADPVITAAAELPGTTSIVVTAADGTTTSTYEVMFTVAAPSTDASLSDIQIDGVTVSGFASTTFNYDVELEEGTTTVPTVTATATDANATVVITSAGSLPGQTRLVVTAEDGSTRSVYLIDFSVAGDRNLLSNGNFEAGAEFWTTNYGGPEIITEGGNSFFFANVETPAANSYDVNLSQVLELTTDETYVLSFEASTGEGQVDRTIIVGIGQNSGDYVANTRTVTLKAGPGLTKYTYRLPANFEAGENSRVLFDLGAEAGVVVLDNITLTVPFKDAALPITFEDPDVQFNLTDFEGAATELFVTNPNVSGVNNSASVAQTLKTEGAAALSGTAIELASSIDFNNGKIFNVKTLAPASGITVEMKLENATNSDISVSATAVNTVADQWEVLSFDFSSLVTDQDLAKVVLIFDNAAAGTGQTFYWDDIIAINPSTDVTLTNLEVDGNTVDGFSVDKLSYSVELPFGTTEVPVVTATANSEQATVEITPASSLPGTTLVLVTAEDGNTTETYSVSFTIADPSTNASLSDLKIGDQTVDGFDAGLFSYKVLIEDGVVPTVSATLADELATLVVTQATSIPGSATVVVTAQDVIVTNTYTIDFVDEVVELPVDFESSTLSYEFSNSGGTVTTVIDNPQTSDANTSSKVAQSIKGSAEVTAGTTLALEKPIAFGNSSAISLKVFSPQENIELKMTLESSGGADAERTQTVSSANTWETVAFDFLGDIASDYEGITLTWADGSESDAGENWTFLFDDIMLSEVEASTDATLSDLQVDGTTVEGFIPSLLDYSVVLPAGTTTVPTVSATTTVSEASFVIENASQLPGTTTINVTAQDGSKTLTYSVAFTIEGAAIHPESGATDPSNLAADVLSIYSDVYQNVPNNGYANYGAAEFEEIDLSGNNTLNYTFIAGDGGNFQVIELGSENQIDLTSAGLTNFRFDVWFPNEIDASDQFILKVVDIPAGGDLSEAVITLNPSSTPAMSQGQWLSYDFEVSALIAAGLAGTENIQQIVIDLSTMEEVYLDNVYFYKESNPAADASLSSITVDGSLLDGFNPNITEYVVTLPEGTTAVPLVAATASQSDATLVITDATEIPGETVIIVTAADGVTNQTYTIGFEVDEPLSLSHDKLMVYASGKTLHIREAGNSSLNVSVYNLEGRRVGSRTFNNSLAWDIDHSGVVIVIIVNETDGTIQKEKVLLR
ncbi:MAG: hypothetical protein ACO2ZZ_11930, partial [Cyclobacteriaceae bacterium]